MAKSSASQCQKRIPTCYSIDARNKEDVARLAQADGQSASEYANRAISQYLDVSKFGPTVLSLVNYSAKSGKTTAATYLSIALGDAGKRVLVVDLDFQGRVSMKLLGDQYAKLEYGVLDTFELYDHRNDTLGMEEIVAPTRFENVQIAPNAFFSPNWKHLCSLHLEHEYTATYGWHLQLRNALKQMEGDYDFIVIDCPSDFGAFTKMSIEAQWAGNRTSRVVIPWREGEWRLPSPKPVIEKIGEISKGGELGGARYRILYQGILGKFPEKYPGMPCFSAMGEMENPVEHEEGSIVESLRGSWELVAREVIADAQKPCSG